MPRHNRSRAPIVAIASAVLTSLALQASAQVTPGYSGYPTQPTQPGPFRQAFAQSLASVVGNVGGAMANGLTGALTTWLNRKAQGRAAMANNYYPMANGPMANGPTTNGPTSNGYPPMPGASPPYYDPGTPPPLPPPAYPGDAQGGGYPGTNPAPIPGQVPSAQGGYPGENGPIFDASGGTTPPNPGGYPTTGGTDPYGGYPNPNTGGYPNSGYPGLPASSPGGVYAGIAYEVYAIGPAGPERVDPATHSFTNGERFNVYYTPSLPGQVDVYNVNPQNQQSHIDSVAVAGGQLVMLGPYEFRDLPGNETLIIELSPCSTDALLNVTRTIVKANDGATPSLNLAQCGGPNTRGLHKRPKTRTIAKVGSEQGTMFALDPLSQAEYSSGNVAPRQVAITLMHH